MADTENPKPEDSQGSRKITTGRDYIEHVGGDVHIHSAEVSPTADEVSLREAYLTWLISDASRISLAGIDRKAASSEAEASLYLDKIYTALLTRESVQERGIESLSRETFKRKLQEAIRTYSDLDEYFSSLPNVETVYDDILQCAQHPLVTSQSDTALRQKPLYAISTRRRGYYGLEQAIQTLKENGQYPEVVNRLQELHKRTLEQDRQERQISAITQLNQHQRLVLLGDPGSGKSTFVKFVVMCLAGELLGAQASLPAQDAPNLALLTAPLPGEERKENQKPQPWDHGALLPLSVTLRDFAAEGLPPAGQKATVKHLWTFITRNLEKIMLEKYASYLHQYLLTHSGLLMLDGLDEVPEASQRRTQIKQAIEDFARTFPRCRILVTSRTYAYQQQDWRLHGFAEAVLAPFSEAQIRFFVDHWYAHIAEVRGMTLNNALGRAEVLKRAIFGNDRLYDFAKRPLLLTLMASLHAWRGGSLPERRGELYDEAADLLLDWWEKAKVVRDAEGHITIEQPSLTEMLQVGKDGVRQVLNALAFEAHQGQFELEGTADVSEGTLISTLMNLSKNKDLRPGRLIEFLRDRAGLLIPRGVEVYTFPHRTFQEYLAACYLTDQDDYPENIAELARNDPDRWREVVLLAGARAARIAPMVWALVDALCYRECPIRGATFPSSEGKPTPDPSQEGNASETLTVQDAWGALLAGQALIETANLQKISPRNQSKVDRVRKWLVAILTEQVPKEKPFPAVERALAGNFLAVLGDPRPGVGVGVDGLPDIVWYEVPEGPFLMGSDLEKDKDAFSQEQPQHDVFLSAYQISRYPVTNAQYQIFVEDGGYMEQWQQCWREGGWEWKEAEQIIGPEHYGGTFDLPNHPVVGISWYEAVAFCAWLTLRLQESGELSEGRAIRLPTEAQWEKAARGTDGRIYSWGDDITPELANYDETGLGTTSTVGCFSRGVSPYDCEDMVGNVEEWCWDWYDNDYYKNSPEKDPQGPESGSCRMNRGGDWGDYAGVCRSAFRNDWPPPGHRYPHRGLRLLRTYT